MDHFDQKNISSLLAEILENTKKQDNQSPWLDTDQAAGYLNCSSGTLKTWRSRGEGPAYHVINHKLVRYNVDDLNAYVRGEVAR
ncbi:MAG: helix-turn-helix domain-containing protein [Parasphingorhabdus sp.]|uniref:helix-turn-helix domain-containing protein n=1 Tax=Parasphingorhabdus sp. TaxID=2709688 RepID=UPI0032718CDA